MDSLPPPPVKIGERRTSDLIVRLRTEQGRDERFYCHSQLLAQKSTYFAERLSPEWPTCQILDSRICVDVLCREPDFDFYVCALRLLYASPLAPFHNVRNALGILRVAINLGCQQIADSCLGYLEASPWEEAEEEEILRSIPGLGSEYECVLARLKPVDSTSIAGTFISAMRFATSSPPASMHQLKSSAQEQLEYMLTEDDDAPLLNSCDLFKAEARKCTNNLMINFHNLLGLLQKNSPNKTHEGEKFEMLQSYLADISWACQILAKLDLLKDTVHFWVDSSTTIVETLEQVDANGGMIEIKLKVVEVAAKVLEAIGYGNVILPTAKRLKIVKIWLPFAQKAKVWADSSDTSDGDETSLGRVDGEMWQSIESAFVSIILALPSGDQAEILSDWLKDEHVGYPDLSEAFEVWCYRHKVARRRMAFLNGSNSVPL